MINFEQEAYTIWERILHELSRTEGEELIAAALQEAYQAGVQSLCEIPQEECFKP